MGYLLSIAALLDNPPGMAYRYHNDPARTKAFVSDGCDVLTGYQWAEFIGNRMLASADLLPAAGHDRVRPQAQATLKLSERGLIMHWVQTSAGVETWFREQGSDDGRREYLDVLIPPMVRAGGSPRSRAMNSTPSFPTKLLPDRDGSNDRPWATPPRWCDSQPPV